ncbi:MAG: GNAT family N-acetyltransferase [Pseudomonadales bacterium]
MLDFDWVQANAECFYAESKLFVAVLSKGERVVGIAPLARCKRDGIPWLELIGASATYEAGGFLYDTLDDLRLLLVGIWQLGHPIALEKVAFGGLSHPSTGPRVRKAGLFLYPGRPSVPKLELSGTWPDYYASMSSQRRYDYRRSNRRLKEGGLITVDFERPSVDSLEKSLLDAFSVESRSWKSTSGTAILQSESMQRFLELIACRYALNNELVLGFLRVSGYPVAMQIGVLNRNRYWILKIGYDSEWARASPGNYLMTEAIRFAFDQGLDGVEFLGSSEPWLRAWTTDAHEFHNVLYFPFSTAGVTNLLSLAGRAVTARCCGSRA